MIAGHVANIRKNGYEGDVCVTFAEYEGSRPGVNMRFSDQQVIADRLAHLGRGTRMTVAGRIEYCSRIHIDLQDCKIISVSLPQ